MDNTETLNVFAWLTLALVGKLVLLNLAVGPARMRAGAFISPEDVKMFGNEKSRVDVDFSLAGRIHHAHRNEIENTPIFLILALAFALAGGAASTLSIYGWVFVAARYTHGIFYLTGTQPFRFLSFLIGFLAIIGLSVLLVRMI